MAAPRATLIAGYLLASLLIEPLPAHAAAQNPAPSGVEEPPLTFSRADSLGLPPATATQLQQDLERHDYIGAETLLLPEISRDPRSPHAVALLDFLGGVYFLDRDYLHAAVAWNKSQAIAPLPTSLRFSLAMAYIRMGRSDWARKALEALAAQNPREALYAYWLGRLDFDQRAYSQAIAHFNQAITQAPDMARAYDSLGLCYYHQNQNTLATQSFQKAIDLDRTSPHPSAWPWLNLAITQQEMNQSKSAEANLREAIRLDPGFAQAHFQLGNVLESSGQTQAAIAELRAAAGFDPNYAEPHFALAHIYRSLGQESAARSEVKTYLALHARTNSPSPSDQKQP
jgi:tetratricopeptide (TPR) repeat protein